MFCNFAVLVFFFLSIIICRFYFLNFLKKFFKNPLKMLYNAKKIKYNTITLSK